MLLVVVTWADGTTGSRLGVMFSAEHGAFTGLLIAAGLTNSLVIPFQGQQIESRINDRFINRQRWIYLCAVFMLIKHSVTS